MKYLITLLTFFVSMNMVSQVNLNLPKTEPSFLMKNRDNLSIISSIGLITSLTMMKNHPNMKYASGAFLMCSVSLQIPEIKKHHKKKK